MELKIFRDALPAAGADCTVKAELPLETEILISDYLPPVFKLVKCFAKPVVLQKQLQPGKLTLEGYLRCIVYYQGEEDAGLCQTEQKLPFNKVLELPEFTFTAWTAQVEGQTEYLNCRSVTPRRVEVRGAFGLVASVYTQLKTEVITALSDGGIEQRLTTLEGVRRSAVLDKLVTVEGELAFPSLPAAILDLAGTVSVHDLKVLNAKAVAKGTLSVLCAWRAEGDNTLQSQSVELPFNQVLDVEGLSEDCRCLCVAEPVGFTVTQGEGDGHPDRVRPAAGCRGKDPCVLCLHRPGAASLAGEILGADGAGRGDGLWGEQPCRVGKLREDFGACAAAADGCAGGGRALPGVLAEHGEPAMQMHGRGTGCLGDSSGGRCCAPPQREQLRGQHCAGGEAGPCRPGDLPPHLLRPSGGGTVRHREALPCFAGADARSQRPRRGDDHHRQSPASAGAGCITGKNVCTCIPCADIFADEV